MLELYSTGLNCLNHFPNNLVQLINLNNARILKSVRREKVYRDEQNHVTWPRWFPQNGQNMFNDHKGLFAKTNLSLCQSLARQFWYDGHSLSGLIL